MNVRRAFTVLSLLALISCWTFCCGASDVRQCEDVNLVIDALQNRYDETIDISARFRQVTFTPGDPKGVVAEGRVYFKRPQLMRWEYDVPEKQLIVTGGKDVYLYEVDARQVSVISRDRFLSSRVSRAFFFGKGDVRKEFDIEGCERLKGAYKLRFSPKKQIPQLKELTLFIDDRAFLIHKTIIEDQMGSKTIIEFSDMKVNRGIPDGLFSFTMPKGVDIFRMD